MPISGRLQHVAESASAIGGRQTNCLGGAVRAALERLNGRRLDRLTVLVGKAAVQPNAVSELDRSIRRPPFALAKPSIQADTDAKARIDPRRESKRCGRAIRARGRGCLVPSLVYSVSAEFV
jgi:hypothetical protein